MTIDRQQGLDVSWTGGTLGDVLFRVYSSGGEGLSVSCKWDVSLGSATIPPEALSHLSASAFGAVYSLVRYQVDVGEIEGWSMRVGLGTMATADGGAYDNILFGDAVIE
jgi:hypothetical protein